MKLVFLDMDGVLNSADYRPDTDREEPWDPENNRCWATMVNPFSVVFLNRILKGSDAKVVISSSWRYHVSPNRMQKILASRGFEGEVVGRTPTIPELPKSLQGTGVRGTEIEVWLTKNKHREVEKFVILDDLGPKQFPSLTNHLVQTSWATGLVSANVDRALGILGVQEVPRVSATEALLWWRDAKEGEDMPHDVFITLFGGMYISRTRSDEQWRLTRRGSQALRKLKRVR